MKMTKWGMLGVILFVFFVGCSKKEGGASSSSGALINDPDAMAFLGTAQIQWTYDGLGNFDTERIISSVVNVSSGTATDVVIKFTYSSLSGGGGTIYGTAQTTISSVAAGDSAAFDLFTNLSPNPSSFYRRGEILQAMVPAGSVSMSGNSASSMKKVFELNEFVEKKSTETLSQDSYSN